MSSSRNSNNKHNSLSAFDTLPYEEHLHMLLSSGYLLPCLNDATEAKITEMGNRVHV